MIRFQVWDLPKFLKDEINRFRAYSFLCDLFLMLRMLPRTSGVGSVLFEKVMGSNPSRGNNYLMKSNKKKHFNTMEYGMVLKSEYRCRSSYKLPTTMFLRRHINMEAAQI